MRLGKPGLAGLLAGLGEASCVLGPVISGLWGSCWEIEGYKSRVPGRHNSLVCLACVCVLLIEEQMASSSSPQWKQSD